MKENAASPANGWKRHSFVRSLAKVEILDERWFSSRWLKHQQNITETRSLLVILSGHIQSVSPVVRRPITDVLIDFLSLWFHHPLNHSSAWPISLAFQIKHFNFVLVENERKKESFLSAVLVYNIITSYWMANCSHNYHFHHLPGWGEDSGEEGTEGTLCMFSAFVCVWPLQEETMATWSIILRCLCTCVLYNFVCSCLWFLIVSVCVCHCHLDSRLGWEVCVCVCVGQW